MHDSFRLGNLKLARLIFIVGPKARILINSLDAENIRDNFILKIST